MKKESMQKKQSQAASDKDSKLAEFFHEELKDIYWAEQHLVKKLPAMQKAASSEELQNAFADHLELTKEHVSRLEKVFELLGFKPEAKKCDGMEGLVKEGEHIIEETEDGSSTRDVGLIMAAQKVEHYEIATYGVLAQLAKTMGNDEVKQLLGSTLEEEKQTDELLTAIAENSINSEAATEEA